MLTVVKKNINFIIKSIKCNFASIAEYKESFILQAACMFINNIFFLIFWFTVFKSSDENINGVTFNNVLCLLSMSSLAYGIAFTFFGGTSKLGKYILEGGLDSFILQPKNVILNVMVSGMDFSAFGDIVYGLLLGLYVSNFNMGSFFLIVFAAILGAIFFVCTECIIRLLTILIGNTDYIESVYIITLMTTFSIYPEAIYGKFVKLLIYTVIPSAYVTHMPLKLMSNFDFKDLIIYLFAIICYVCFTIFFSKKMLKKYESGNQMALKS